MTFDNALKLMADQSITHVRVMDTNNKRVLDIDGGSVEDAVQKITEHKAILSTYGRVNFLCATDSIRKQNWKDAYSWAVTFTGSNEQAPKHDPGIGRIPSGFVSQNEAMLMAQLQALTIQMDYTKKMSELEAKFTLAQPKNEGFEKYIPMMGMFMDIDQTKMQNMMMLMQMQTAMNGKQPAGISGLFTPENTAAPAQLQTTDDEKKLLEDINNNMEALSEKVSLDKINQLLKLLADKPEYADMALNFAAMNG